MNPNEIKLILCEGKTDAILISYYLSAVCQWKYHRRAPHGLNIKTDPNKGETADWYTKDDHALLICAVGGVNKFESFFKEKIEQLINVNSSISKIAIIVDKDDRQEDEIVLEFSLVSDKIQNLISNVWTENSYSNSYGQETSLASLLLIIPQETEGALETLLLQSIATHSQTDKFIVDSTDKFINQIAPYAVEYIGKRRLRLKAKLGVTFAIQSPQKVFTFIDDQIRSVNWEASELLSQSFAELVKI